MTSMACRGSCGLSLFKHGQNKISLKSMTVEGGLTPPTQTLHHVFMKSVYVCVHISVL